MFAPTRLCALSAVATLNDPDGGENYWSKRVSVDDPSHPPYPPPDPPRRMLGLLLLQTTGYDRASNGETLEGQIWTSGWKTTGDLPRRFQHAYADLPRVTLPTSSRASPVLD